MEKISNSEKFKSIIKNICKDYESKFSRDGLYEIIYPLNDVEIHESCVPTVLTNHQIEPFVVMGMKNFKVSELIWDVFDIDNLSFMFGEFLKCGYFLGFIDNQSTITSVSLTDKPTILKTISCPIETLIVKMIICPIETLSELVLLDESVYIVIENDTIYFKEVDFKNHYDSKGYNILNGGFFQTKLNLNLTIRLIDKNYKYSKKLSEIWLNYLTG